MEQELECKKRKVVDKAGGDATPVLPSVPEPPPKGGEVSVTQTLLALLKHPSAVGDLSYMLPGEEPSKIRSMLEEATQLIGERRAYGMDKYGTELKTKNGRNACEDARQELGDAMQYVFQAKLEGLDVAPLRNLYDVLGMLLDLSHHQIKEGGSFWLYP